MADPVGFGSSWGYKTQEENLKVACANLDTGFILFTFAANLGYIVVLPQSIHQLTNNPILHFAYSQNTLSGHLVTFDLSPIE